jgi:hypothetical protein
MTTKSELIDQIDRLTKLTDALRSDNRKKAANIAARDQQIATLQQQPIELVPIKRAASDAGIDHKLALRWCERGWIKSATRQGGRWFANVDDLKLTAALRGPLRRSLRL